MLMLGLCFPLLLQAQDTDQANFNYWIGVTAISGTVLGTTAYWAFRESNEAKIQRVHRLYYFYTGNLHEQLASITTLQDMIYFLSHSIKFKKEVLVFSDFVHQLYREMSARYTSWLKPWNWSQEMKREYERIKELHNVLQLIDIMICYQPFILDWRNSFDEAAVIKQAQILCRGTTVYPLCTCVDMIKKDLAFLKATNFKISCDVVLIEMLEHVLNFMVCTQAYVAEQQMRHEFNLLERQTYAAELQALAQQSQAQAQHKQAEAQKDRNKIEQEKANKQ